MEPQKMTDKTTGAGEEMYQKALENAALGFPVFPLQILAKEPLIKDYPSIATTDPSKIKELWTDALGDIQPYNIGMLTGRGIIAVDYDVKRGVNGLEARDVFDKKGLPTSIRVKTPSGGEHLILKIPKNVIIGSSASKLAPGVDTRGHRGYVAGPGSRIRIDGELREYEWLNKKPVSDAGDVPEWFMRELLTHCRYTNSPKSTRPDIAVDTDAALAHAKRYLTNDAPSAIEGAGGDQTTYSVASRVIEIGLGPDMALAMMLEHWNEQKASPPWSYDDLEQKVFNAAKYMQERQGAASADADFSVVHVEEDMVREEKADDWPKPTLITPYDPSELPKREFIFDGLFAKGTVSAMVAPSGAGKTQWLIQMALALATCDEDIIKLKPAGGRKRKTWLWNQEDTVDELKRRLSACMIHFDKGFHDVGKRIFMDSGVDQPLKVVGKDGQGRVRATKHVQKIIERIIAERIDVFVADPLVEFHGAEENDNVQMAFVASQLRRIAVEANCAVIVGHHDRKPESASSTGHVGNQHAMRGASSMQGVTRAIVTLYTMSDADAKELKVPPEQRARYVRMDGAKNNLGLPGGAPTWFERYGQALDMDGDEVGVLRPSDVGVGRVTFEADPWHVVLRAMRRTVELERGWHRWSDLLKVLVDDDVWEPEARRGEKTWKNWMSEKDSGVMKTDAGDFEIVKKGTKAGNLIRHIEKEKEFEYDFLG